VLVNRSLFPNSFIHRCDMDAVLRAVAIYLALLVLFRISGRRPLAELTSFDFVLLMIIGEATQLIDGGPTIVDENGQFLRQRMYEARIEEDDIMQAARLAQGVETVDQIKYAIIERNGQISIINKA
jgi:uncharacterized membrane protein YcaP (DUF421 family)